MPKPTLRPGLSHSETILITERLIVPEMADFFANFEEGASVFGVAPFPTLPFYSSNPWFVPLAMRWFDWKDAWFARKGV